MKTIDLQIIANELWYSYCKVFPELIKFECPIIKINNRFTVTGGVNYSETNIVELAGKYFINNTKEMLTVILPHELAHQIDFNLHGWKKGQKHHGNNWCYIMHTIGQYPDPYHNMVL